MLLSMYLLYRYARSGRSKSYLFDIGVFVVLISLFSVFFPVTGFLFVLSLFCFPFYFWAGELAAPSSLGLDLSSRYPWLHYHSVRFLVFDLNLTPDWELSGGQITEYSVWSNYNNGLLIAFSVFFLVNVLGGALGYVIGRRREVAVMSEERWAIVGIACMAAAFVLLLESVFPLSGARTSWMQVAGALAFFSFAVGVVVLGALVLSFLVDHVTRARVSTLMVLVGLIVFLVGQNAGQALMVVGGSLLAVFGCINYFVKLTIDYVRGREQQLSAGAPVEQK